MTTTEPTQALHSTPNALVVFEDQKLFSHYQRVAQMLSECKMVPEHLRGPERVGDIMIACAIAREMQINPVLVLQNIYFVGGRAGWSSSFLISRANNSGLFDGPIMFRTAKAGEKVDVEGRTAVAGQDIEVTTVEGPKGDRKDVVYTVPNVIVTAYATLAGVDGDAVIEYSADLILANAEGWTSNGKYLTIPARMLSYRAASALINMHCPQVKFGMPMHDDPADGMIDITPSPRPARPTMHNRATNATTTPQASSVVDVTATEIKEEPEPEQEHDTETNEDGIPVINEWGEPAYYCATAEAYEKAVDAMLRNASPKLVVELFEANEPRMHPEFAARMQALVNEITAADSGPEATKQPPAEQAPTTATASEKEMEFTVPDVPMRGNGTKNWMEWYGLVTNEAHRLIAEKASRDTFVAFHNACAPSMSVMSRELRSWADKLQSILVKMTPQQ